LYSLLAVKQRKCGWILRRDEIFYRHQIVQLSNYPTQPSVHCVPRASIASVQLSKLFKPTPYLSCTFSSEAKMSRAKLLHHRFPSRPTKRTYTHTHTNTNTHTHTHTHTHIYIYIYIYIYISVSKRFSTLSDI
jgi:hypothetical protein